MSGVAIKGDKGGPAERLLEAWRGEVQTAGAVSLVAHFLVGAAKSLFTLRTWWSAGLEMTAAGVLVGGITYAVGLVLH